MLLTTVLNQCYRFKGLVYGQARFIRHLGQQHIEVLVGPRKGSRAQYSGCGVDCVQAQGIVPIVEPEVLIDGDHSIDRCAAISEAVLHDVFHALYRHHVVLEHMLLKPNMVTAGKAHAHKASPGVVAAQTLRIFRCTVPAAVPSINFLSGGQTPEEVTANLNAMNCVPQQPWGLSFSYGRALQEPALLA